MHLFSVSYERMFPIKKREKTKKGDNVGSEQQMERVPRRGDQERNRMTAGLQARVPPGH